MAVANVLETHALKADYPVEEDQQDHADCHRHY